MRPKHSHSDTIRGTDYDLRMLARRARLHRSLRRESLRPDAMHMAIGWAFVCCLILSLAALLWFLVWLLWRHR